MGWWVISDEDLRTQLERVRCGEDVDMVLVELYANSDVERVNGDGE